MTWWGLTISNFTSKICLRNKTDLWLWINNLQILKQLKSKTFKNLYYRYSRSCELTSGPNLDRTRTGNLRFVRGSVYTEPKTLKGPGPGNRSRFGPEVRKNHCMPKQTILNIISSNAWQPLTHTINEGPNICLAYVPINKKKSARDLISH